MNFPEKYSISDFDISPYPTPRGREYMELIAEQWHIVMPYNMKYANEEEKKEYEKQFDEFTQKITETLKNDLASGKYRDYAITDKNGKICGIVDAGKICFEIPEVGIILKEEYRRCGAGYTIMKDFIEKVKTLNRCENVVWRTESTNTAAIALAKKLGAEYELYMDEYLCFII